MSFFVTGATGCVGQALLERHHSSVERLVAMDITPPPDDAGNVKWVRGDILDAESYEKHLQGVDVVIHLAAKVHSVPRSKEDADRFWKINLDGTKTLIAAALSWGVRRFVYVSTVAVPPPQGGIQAAYAESKRAAERVVMESSGRIEVIVVRPATVYGPGDKGNVHRLIRWVDRGLPSIIGSGENRKSMVYSWNLADALFFLSTHGKSGATYVVTDGVNLSMKEIVGEISRHLGKRTLRLPIPMAAAIAASAFSEWTAERLGFPKVFGREMFRKLVEETTHDPEALFALGFRPAFSFRQGMEEAVRWYKRHR